MYAMIKVNRNCGSINYCQNIIKKKKNIYQTVQKTFDSTCVKVGDADVTDIQTQPSYISFSSWLRMTLAPLASVRSCLLQRIRTGGALFETVLSLRSVYRYLRRYSYVPCFVTLYQKTQVWKETTQSNISQAVLFWGLLKVPQKTEFQLSKISLYTNKKNIFNFSIHKKTDNYHQLYLQFSDDTKVIQYVDIIIFTELHQDLNIIIQGFHSGLTERIRKTNTTKG